MGRPPRNESISLSISQSLLDLGDHHAHTEGVDAVLLTSTSTSELTSANERSAETVEIRLRLVDITLVTEPGTQVRFLAGVTNGLLSASKGSLSIYIVSKGAANASLVLLRE